MDAATLLVFQALSLSASILSIAFAVSLLAWPLNRRSHFGWRVVAIAVLVSAVALVLSASVQEPLPAASPGSAHVTVYVPQFFSFSGVLLACAAMVVFLFDASVWTALFCATAGYAVQNLASGLMELVWTLVGPRLGALEGELVRLGLSAALFVVIYVPFYLLVVRRIRRDGLEQIGDWRMLLIMVAVICGVIGFDLAIKSLTAYGAGVGYVVIFRLCHALTCVLTFVLEYELLVSRYQRTEREATERVLAERERQYQQSRENIEAINIKCHDIRHQIRALADGGAGRVSAGALDDIAREVDVYDSTMHTGNEALDTILTEKGLRCRHDHITLSCIADGSALDFMSPADIYSLFGNALDNAIEAAGALEDPTRRSISLLVRRVAGCASIHVENSFAGERELGPDGLPMTTKADRANHGFGVRSMRLTVERYGGTLTTLAQGGHFHVNAIIPMP